MMKRVVLDSAARGIGVWLMKTFALPRTSFVVLAAMLATAPVLHARTVYLCVQKGISSLSTAPEPGSSCRRFEIDDNSAMPFRKFGITRGTLYRRHINGRTIYGTRKLPGAVAVQKFAFHARVRHSKRARLGKPRIDIYKQSFREAAASTSLDEAWLRAIAHVESRFQAKIVSPKGAMGVMQLMPATARNYKVDNPFDPHQSIRAGARHLRVLSDLYEGDRIKIAAAYNAGAGAVARYGGVPPYAETRSYVDKVMRTYARYRAAMGITTGAATQATGKQPIAWPSVRTRSETLAASGSLPGLMSGAGTSLGPPRRALVITWP